MGRWCSGSIDHKFWVGIQSSDAADRFGVTGHQPEELYTIILMKIHYLE